MAAPVVSSVSPNQGPAAGGTTVTVTGTSFTGATAVRFVSKAATSFTVNSSTQITAVSPSGTGTVNVTVTTIQGSSTQTVTFTYVTVSAPSLAGLSPSQSRATVWEVRARFYRKSWLAAWIRIRPLRTVTRPNAASP